MSLSWRAQNFGRNLLLDYFLETFPSVTREQAAAVLRYGWQRIEGELAA